MSVAFSVNAKFDLILIILTVIANFAPNFETLKAVKTLTFSSTFTGSIKISFLISILSLTSFTFFIVILITDTVCNIISNSGNYKEPFYVINPLFEPDVIDKLTIPDIYLIMNIKKLK